MAHAISLTDGTTTITFTAVNGYQVLEYDMLVGESEGAALPSDIAETMQVIISGSNTAQVQSRLGVLNRMLAAARQRTRWGLGPRVYLQLRIDGESDTWRSELLDAAPPEPQEDSLRLWPNMATVFNLHLRRVSFWEAVTLVQVPLSNANGTNNTSGLTIVNHDDATAGKDNYAQIGVGVIAGDLPTPLQIELTNTSGAAVQYGQIMMACNAFSDPANLTHVLQAESVLVSGATVASDATCSNGQYTTVTFTNSYGQVYSLSSALLRDTQGYDFHLLVRFKAVTSAAFVRPSIYDSAGLYPIWVGNEVYLPLISPAVADLGVVPLPPGGYAGISAGLTLRLDWRSATTTAVDTDFFALFPAHTYRRLSVLASVNNGGAIADDAPNERAWVNNGAGEIASVSIQGMPLVVWPGLAQRLYFIWYQANMAAPINQSFTVKAWCRPRRSTF